MKTKKKGNKHAIRVQMLFLCGKCNTLAVNVSVSITRNTTE